MKEKEYFIKREQDDAKGAIKVVKRDFYDSLPRAVIEVLDNISWRWRNYDWFEEAWNKYRDHVLNAESSGTGIKAPGFIFNDYIDDQVKQDFLNREQCEVLHSALAIDELMHVIDATGRVHIEKGMPGAGRFAKKTDTEKASSKESATTSSGGKTVDDDSYDEFIKRIKKENDAAEALEKHNKYVKAPTEEEYKRTTGMLKEGKNVTAELSTILQERRGSRRVNPKETKINDDRPYKEISDDELNKRVRRMQLERQYGDLTGDAKYEQTGKEKAREYLQTIGAMLGIAISALTIYNYIKNK